MERLIEPYDASDKSLSPSVRLSITHRGLIHLDLAVFQPVFLEQLALTTRITNPEVAEELRAIIKSDQPISNQMSSLRSQFVKFIISEDSHFGNIPKTQQYECQQVLNVDLERYLDENFELSFDIPAEGPLASKITGILEWFDKSKGFGFVSFDGEYSRAFLHVTTLQAAKVDEIADGDIIICDIDKGQKGVSVTHIHNVQRSDAFEHGFIKAKIVKVFKDRGYGFVHSAQFDIDAFFHFSAVDEGRREELQEDYEVSVEINKDPKGRGFQVRRLLL